MSTRNRVPLGKYFVCKLQYFKRKFLLKTLIKTFTLKLVFSEMTGIRLHNLKEYKNSTLKLTFKIKSTYCLK